MGNTCGTGKLKAYNRSPARYLHSQAGVLVGAGLNFVMVYDYGLGRHQYYLDPQTFQHFRKYQYGQWVQFIWTVTATQMSVCLLLIRFRISRQLQKPLWYMLGIILLSNLILVLLWIFQCTPVRLTWRRTREGRCFSDSQIQGIILAQGILSILADLILALTPFAIFRYFHVNLRCKLALCVLGSLALFTAACSIVRTIYSWENVTTDETWLVATYLWRGAEANLAIVLACIPTLPLLCRYLIGSDPPSPRNPLGLPPGTSRVRSRRPSETQTPTSTRDNKASQPPTSRNSSLSEYRIPIKKNSIDMTTTNTSDTATNDNLTGGRLQDTSWLDVPQNQPEWSKAWLATDSNASTT